MDYKIIFGNMPFAIAHAKNTIATATNPIEAMKCVIRHLPDYYRYELLAEDGSDRFSLSGSTTHLLLRVSDVHGVIEVIPITVKTLASSTFPE